MKGGDKKAEKSWSDKPKKNSMQILPMNRSEPQHSCFSGKYFTLKTKKISCSSHTSQVGFGGFYSNEDNQATFFLFHTFY